MMICRGDETTNLRACPPLEDLHCKPIYTSGGTWYHQKKSALQGGVPMKEPQGKQHTFFSHRACEYFPCHKGVSEEDFNCLFCYCPLYPLGETCGGDFVLLEDGTKDCSGCAFPHRRENYEAVTAAFPRIAELFREK